MIQKVFVPVNCAERLPNKGVYVVWINKRGDLFVGYLADSNQVMISGQEFWFTPDFTHWLEEREIELYEDTKSTIGPQH